MIDGLRGRYQRSSLILRACSSACAASAPRAALRCSAWASAAATSWVLLAWARVSRSLLRLPLAPRRPSTVPTPLEPLVAPAGGTLSMTVLATSVVGGADVVPPEASTPPTERARVATPRSTGGDGR